MQKKISTLSIVLLSSGLLSAAYGLISQGQIAGWLSIVLGVLLFLLNKKVTVETIKGLKLMLLSVGLICVLFLTALYAHLKNNGLVIDVKLVINTAVLIFLVPTTGKLLKAFILHYLKAKKS